MKSRILCKFNKFLPDILLVSILSVCCFISLSWEIFSLVMVGISVYIFFMFGTEKSLCLVSFLIPFHNTLRLSNLTIIVYILYVTFLVITFSKLMYKHELNFNKIILGMLALLALYSLLPFGSYKLIRWRWISTFLIIIVTCFLLKNEIKKIDYSKVVYFLFFGILISTLFRVMLNCNDFINKFQLNYSNRFEALMINTNYLSEACAMLCSMLIVLLYKHKNTIFTSACFLTTIFIGIQTRSKSFFLLSIIFLGFFCVYFIILSFKKKKPVLIFIISVLFILSMAGLIILFKSRLDDVGNLTSTNLLTNRNTIWKMTLKKLTKNTSTLLFGLGVGSEIRWENAQTCHCVYLEILQKFGIIGTSIFILLTIYCIYLLIKKYNLKSNLINFFPVAILAIYSLTDTIIFPATSMMIFPICFVMLFYMLTEKNKN